MAMISTIITAVPKTNVTGSVLVASNPDRKGLIIQNNLGAVLYIKFGTGGDNDTNFSVAINSNTTFFVPDIFVTSMVTGRWDTSGGQQNAALITQAFNT